MVNSSQESDFYGFPSTPVNSVNDTKIPEYKNNANDATANAKNAATNATRTTQSCRKFRGSTSNECGLEQTIASEEYSDQDIRCMNEMTRNQHQFEARVENASVDEENGSQLTIEPTSSSDEDDNDGDRVKMHKGHAAKAAVVTPTASYPLHCTLDEDSNNAVDNAISSERCVIGNSSTPTDLSFNGKLKNLRASLNTNASINDSSTNDPKDLTTISSDKSNLELQLQLETSREHINERSPDLFSEVDDFENATANDALTENDIAAAGGGGTSALADDDDADVSAINDSADLNNDGTSAAFWSDKLIEKTERAVNKRIQTLLSGIIPPPSITFVQHDISNLLSIYKRNITLMDLSRINVRYDNNESDDTDKVPMMPREIENVAWPKIRQANAYGVHYNRTKYTENIESMHMKLVERFVGQETASSFKFSAPSNTSAAAKKKPLRKLYVIRMQRPLICLFAEEKKMILLLILYRIYSNPPL